MPTLLVVDDEPSILLAFRRAFGNMPLNVITAATAAAGLTEAKARRPDAIVLDIQLPDRTGLDLFRELRALDARCPVIFISGKSTTDTAIEAMKLGAYEYLLKPLELASLRDVIERALAISRLMHVPAVVADSSDADEKADAIIGRCPAMLEVYKAIGRVADQDVTVLIAGESGTGKELVARALYQHSRRAAGPFLAINCASLQENLLESELFGHEKGAFTGADRQRIGKFEQCAGGTLFLDEVAELSSLAQTKMLRLLQEREFERVGGNETVRADVRLLAATNQDLEARVRQGLFREDLYYRLSGYLIPLPPLRDRGDDLALLVHHYMRRAGCELDKETRQVAPETLDLLKKYRWPGNVRELQGVIKQALLQAVGSILIPEFLPAVLRSSSSPGLPANQQHPVDHGNGDLGLAAVGQFIDERLKAGSGSLFEETWQRVERGLVTRVLQHTSGNQAQAAKILGITRGSLRLKIREHGITIARTVEAGEEGAVS